MRNRWNIKEASEFSEDSLQLRVYSSQLLGQEEDLVLHGGGNTSVKTKVKNLFGEEEDILYVKGSGWDLATIKAEGFAPVKLNTLLKMAELDQLSDLEMVKYQRMAMIDPSAPNPSVEAILHAIIPHKFVDHTHADAVVTISNTPGGENRIRELYGDNMLIVPYVMPGFVLAKTIYEMTKGIDWNAIEGMILLHHGVFTFHNNAQQSYEKMIEIVGKAEQYIEQHTNTLERASSDEQLSMRSIAKLRKAVAQKWGRAILTRFNSSEASVRFSKLPNLEKVMGRGPLTPDHIIRTKRTPVLLSSKFEDDISNFSNEYLKYFNEFNHDKLTCLDTAPRWGIWPKYGSFSFGTNLKNIQIIQDISAHTMKAIEQAEQLDAWHTLTKAELFEMEYWTLEQEKLKKGATAKALQGKIALVTGAASGIGKACVQELVEQGAVVAALDINPDIHNCFPQQEVLAITCDVTKENQLAEALEQTVQCFGGIDLLVSNAGIFPPSLTIEEMDQDLWSNSMNVNLTSHQQLIKHATPYLCLGIKPAIVIVGSKNVPAPGPGAAAYSVAKAGLTQLGRIAALELGKQGIRVNTVHPNAVFDTAIWTEEVITTRAKHYGLTTQAYKTNNLLKTEITSRHIAKIIVDLLGETFSSVTGAQLPIDGGNERTI